MTMTNGLSRRALAAGAAGLAAAGLGPEVADAKRKKRRQATMLVGVDGTVHKERSRVTFSRITSLALLQDDDVEIKTDHSVLVPPTGGYLDYFISGFEAPDADTPNPSPAPIGFKVRAMGGSYDPESGQLLLDPVELIDFDRGEVDGATSRCIVEALVFGVVVCVAVGWGMNASSSSTTRQALPRC